MPSSHPALTITLTPPTNTITSDSFLTKPSNDLACSRSFNHTHTVSTRGWSLYVCHGTGQEVLKVLSKTVPWQLSEHHLRLCEVVDLVLSNCLIIQVFLMPDALVKCQWLWQNMKARASVSGEQPCSPYVQQRATQWRHTPQNQHHVLSLPYTSWCVWKHSSRAGYCAGVQRWLL